MRYRLRQQPPHCHLNSSLTAQLSDPLSHWHPQMAAMCRMTALRPFYARPEIVEDSSTLRRGFMPSGPEQLLSHYGG
jgi:hypothetical protein